MIAVAIAFHMVKSADTNPVVVSTETTEKAACLKASSDSPQGFGWLMLVTKFGSW